MAQNDPRGDKVEKYKLTKEQLSFQKQFKMLKQVQELLQARSIGLGMQIQDERELWESLEGEFRNLRPPQKALHELSGMNFKEEGEQPAWNLRY